MNIKNEVDDKLLERIFEGESVISSTPPFNLPEGLGEELAGTHIRIIRTIGVSGPDKMSSIGKKIGSSHAMMTHLSDQLEEKDIIKRVRSKKDRRLVRLHLTPKGKKILLKLKEEYCFTVSQFLGKMTEKEREEYLSSYFQMQKISAKYSS